MVHMQQGRGARLAGGAQQIPAVAAVVIMNSIIVIDWNPPHRWAPAQCGSQVQIPGQIGSRMRDGLPSQQRGKSVHGKHL